LIASGLVAWGVLSMNVQMLAAAPARTMTINGVAFVSVPAGPFTMGTPPEQCARAQDEPGMTVEARTRARDYCAKWETPPHQVVLPAFSIMRTEVTIAQYDRFVKATGARRPGDQRSAAAGTARQDQSGVNIPLAEARRRPSEPVSQLSWNEARAFCEWLGRGTAFTTRLPTEAEWEKASRGGLSGRRFPWGDTISHAQANYYGYPASSGGYAYDIAPSAIIPPTTMECFPTRVPWVRLRPTGMAFMTWLGTCGNGAGIGMVRIRV
jgi:formylglycine-generating enzyme required for sulfatase activity